MATARLDKHGQPIPCGHSSCGRIAVRIVSFERPRHAEFLGQTHECCAVHSRADR